MELQEIKKILETPKNPDIVNAIKHDARMSFYSDRLNFENKNSYAKVFFEKIETKLSNSRSIDSFNLSLNYPLEINNFTSEIIKKLSEIWNGQNSIFKANTKGKSTKEIPLNINFYKNDVFEYYFKRPNTLIYLEHDGNDINYKFIKSSQIVAFKKIDNIIFDYVIFRSGSFLYYIDKYVLNTYKIIDNDLSKITKFSNVELKNLNVCPIFHISNENYNLESNFVKTNIFADSLSYFDLLQEVFIYKKMLSPYAFNLIIEKYRDTKCKYRNENGEYCSSGYLFTNGKDNIQVPLVRNGAKVRCPECNTKVSPGMEVYKSETFSLDNSQIISDVVKFISPDTGILEYSDTFILKLKETILNSIIGGSKDLNNNQNSNEIAIKKSLTGKLTVILDLKSKFENVIKQIENVKAKWLFNERFVFWTINLGTNFLLSTISELYQELKNATENNKIEVKNIQKQIISTKYITDPINKKRNLILLSFYPDVDVTSELIPLNILNKQLLFNDFVSYFELKYGDIGMSLKSNSEIIMQMNKEFEGYLNNLTKKDK